MNEIKKRFLEIIEEKRIRTTDFANEMGVSQSSVSYTFTKSNFIAKVEYFITLQKLTSCNLNWVIMNFGEKYLGYYINETNYSAAAEPAGDYGNEHPTKSNNLLKEFDFKLFELIKEKNEMLKLNHELSEMLKKAISKIA